MDLVARLRFLDAGFSRGMRNAQRSMSGVSSGVGSIVKQFGLVATAGAAVGLALSSIDKSEEFEQRMAKVGAIADANSKQLQQLKASAMDLGAKTPKSANEIATAMAELASKGFDTNKIISAMPGIINAATASGENLAMTSDVVTSALNAFGLKGSAASHVADVLSMSANKTAAGIEDLGYSFKYAAPVAKTLGIGLEELSAATGMMVDKGLAGEQAGTSIRMGLMRLASAPKMASKEMKKLGFSAVDSHHKFKSLNTIVTELRQKTQGLTQAQKVQAIGQIFGTEAATGWLDLVDSAPGKLKTMTDALVNSNGKAKATSALMLDNAKGNIEILKGSIETLQLKLTTGLLPVISQGAKEFAKWMDGIKPEQIKAWGDSIKDAGQKVLEFANFVKNNWPAIRETFVAVTAGVVAFKVSMAGLTVIKTVITMVNDLRVAYGLLTGAQWALNAAEDANPIGAVILAIAALIGIGVLLYRNWDTVKEKMSAVWNWIERDAAKSVNFMIGAINSLIGLINKIPGVNIPIIPKVDWGAAVKPAGGRPIVGTKSVLPATKGIQGAGGKIYAPNSLSNTFKGFSHAGGLNRVPYDGYPARLHRDETVLTSHEADQYRNGKSGVVQFGDIHLHGVGGNLEQAADKLLNIIARKVESEGVQMPRVE